MLFENGSKSEFLKMVVSLSWVLFVLDMAMIAVVVAKTYVRKCGGLVEDVRGCGSRWVRL